MAVAALNPHACEGGLPDRQDIDVSEPTITKTVGDGVDIVGPRHRVRQATRGLVRRRDRDVSRPGHIPVKLLGFEVDPTAGPSGAFRRQHHAQAADYTHLH